MGARCDHVKRHMYRDPAILRGRRRPLEPSPAVSWTARAPDMQSAGRCPGLVIRGARRRPFDAICPDGGVASSIDELMGSDSALAAS